MIKRWYLLCSLTVLFMILGSAVGFSMPSLAGPTGIVAMPTAAVAPPYGIETALTAQSLKSLDMYGDERSTAWILQALAGIAGGAEGWVTYTFLNDGDSTNLWGIGGKYKVFSEPARPFDLAIGGSFERWSDALSVSSLGMYGVNLDMRKLYIVATKDLTARSKNVLEREPESAIGLYVSAGLYYVSLNADPGGSESLTRPFVGAEMKWPKATLGLEYRAKDNDLDDEAVMSAVLRYAVSNEFQIEIGSTNVSPAGLGLNDQDLFVRIGYTLPVGGPGW